MTIPYLKGADETVGPALSSLADTIGNMINPNAKFNQMMKMAFIQDPGLMQKFVDVEKANPGTLAAFGFSDKASDLLSGMQESIPALKNRLLLPDVAAILQKPATRRVAATELATGKTPGQLEEEDFSEWFTKEGHKLLEQGGPELFMRVARAKWGAGTELEQKKEELQLKAMDRGKQYEGLPPMKLVEKVADPAGGLSTEDLAGILSGPSAEAYGVAQQLYINERNNAIRLLVAKYGGEDDPLFKAQLGAARDAFKASGGVGTLAGWFNRLTGSNRLGTPSGEELNAINASLKDRQADVSVNQQIKFRQGIEPYITAIHKGGTETEQLQRIGSINKLLETEGSQWQAYWNTGTLGFGRGLRFKDKAGNTSADPGVLFSKLPPSDLTPPPPPNQINLNPNELRLVAFLKGVPSGKQASAKAQIKKMNLPPEIEAEILKRGGIE